MADKYSVVLQHWEESERGCGSRPDGFTLHLTSADHKAYLEEQIAAERKRNPSGAAKNKAKKAKE